MNLHIVRFVVLTLVGLSINSSAQDCLYYFSYDDDKEIESRVERILRKRDVGELANELAKKKASESVEDLLFNLSVFGRAGHRFRVWSTLKELSAIYPQYRDKHRILSVARRATCGDLAAQRIFYEQIAVNGDDRAPGFVRLWEEKGDVRELENWLKVRSQNSEEWWNLWANLKKSHGTGNEIVELLARKVRENPADFDAVVKYVNFVSIETPAQIGPSQISYLQDVSWIADVAKTDTAYEAYQLGSILKTNYPRVAIQLLEKSLSFQFTATDLKLLGERAFRFTQIRPIVRNPEKQLRFWTKSALVDLYLKTDQAQRAQPIAEELTRMDHSDIQPDDSFRRAGAVQASSGQRVIESKILQDEATNENSPEYWMNRAAYYTGRKEIELALQAYVVALEKFPYAANDLIASTPRLQILYNLRGFAGGDFQNRAENILRKEFSRSLSENDYRYLFNLLTTTVYEFDDLRDEFLTNTDLLPKIMAVQGNWSYYEIGLIEDVMESERWDAKKRDIVWDKLSEIARKNFSKRAFGLAETMSSLRQYRKAIPLLLDCLKIAPREAFDGSDMDYDQALNFDYDDVEEELVDAYLGIGDWKAAEKIYTDGSRYLQNGIGRIAIVAAQQGKIADAVRIWKINVNFDRRSLRYLDDLAKTGAKVPIRNFYLGLKESDPLSNAPGAALALLK